MSSYGKGFYETLLKNLMRSVELKAHKHFLFNSFETVKANGLNNRLIDKASRSVWFL